MAGDHSRPGDPDVDAPSSLDDALLDQRVDGLVDRGLERYGEGDLEGAITEWEHALALRRDCVRAREYVEYVRQHFDLLRERFDASAAAHGSPGEADVPFGLEDLGDDDDAYDLVQVEYGETMDVEPAPAAPAPAPKPSPYDESVDEGWVLDDESSDMLPAPPPGPADALLDDGLGADLDAVSEGLSSLGSAETLDLDEPPRRAPGAGVHGQFDFGDVDDEQTAEKTQRRLAFARAQTEDEPGEDEITVPGGGGGTGGFDDGLELSSDALQALGARAHVRREVTTSSEETTAERSGIARGLSLDNLDALEGEVRDDRQEVADDALTVERGRGGAGWTGPSAVDPSASIDLDEPLFEEKTRDRSLVQTGHAHERAPTHDSGLNSVIIDESLGGRGATEEDTRELGPGEIATGTEIAGAQTLDIEEETREHRGPRAMNEFEREVDTRDIGIQRLRDDLAAPTEELSAITSSDELDIGAPSDESPSERTRRRLADLIDRAHAESQRGDHAAAVALLARALEEDPDSAVAQKMIHGHRDLLIRIYESYIGDSSDVPILAIPMHELAKQKLDNRAAFLLSRIDGSLSFEEILDVAGMGRLEAYRHLCTLLLKGILEVR